MIVNVLAVLPYMAGIAIAATAVVAVSAGITGLWERSDVRRG